MIFNNLSDKILLVLEEQDYIGASFVVKELSFKGCTSDIVIASGEFKTDTITLVLPDKRYHITVSKEAFPDLEYSFSVYYNYLPEVIFNLKNKLCPCQGCQKEDDTKDGELLLSLVGFMQNMDLLKRNSVFSSNLHSFYNISREAEEYKKYYGVFNSNYSEYLYKIFAEAYVEIYYHTIYTIRDNDVDIVSLNNIFKIDYIEKCIYKKGIEIQQVICDIEKANCDCNGE